MRTDGSSKRHGTQSRFLSTLMASSLGSCVAVICQNPVLIVKVHLQKVRVDKEKKASPGILETARNIYRSRGLRGFWAGLPMGLMQSVPSTALFMLAYEETKKGLRGLLGKESFLYPLVPGIGASLARTASVTLITPIELVRTIQASGVAKSSTFLLQNLYRQRGISGFYLGLRATLFRDVPHTFIYWQSYQMMKDVVLPEGIQSLGSMASVFVAGSISATVAAIFTHPFDVLKTNQQVNIREIALIATVPAPAHAPSALSSATAAVQSTAEYALDESCSSVVDLYKRGGLKTCFRGLSMRLAMVIPGSAIMITVYETVRKFAEID
jgi:hypothetical protein